MFREMRRKKQLLSESEAIEMLKICTSGVLAVSGDHDYPYAVPLSFAYKDGKIYFHSALTGHKIDSIKSNNKVSFCVIQADEVMQKTFTTHYRSAIAFGKARILDKDDEKRAALKLLVEKYSPDFIPEGLVEIENDMKIYCMVEITIDHLTGKAATELVS